MSTSYIYAWVDSRDNYDSQISRNIVYQQHHVLESQMNGHGKQNTHILSMLMMVLTSKTLLISKT